MSDTAWLASLQVGDEVILQDRYANTVKTVSKLTRTQIIIGAGYTAIRFRRDTGREIGGDSWHHMSLHQATDEAKAAIVLEQTHTRVCDVLSKVRRTAVEALTQPQCEQVLAVLRAFGLVE